MLNQQIQILRKKNSNTYIIVHHENNIYAKFKTIHDNFYLLLQFTLYLL